MSFGYVWKNKEANFGRPLERPVKGGAHITVEIVLKYRGKYIALRRGSIPGHEAPPHARKHPRGLLYFCHDLIRYGESLPRCVKRIVKAQTGVGIKTYRVVDIESAVQTKDGQWAIIPCVIAELTKKPVVGSFGNQISEVVTFTKKTVPHDFAWWPRKDLIEFLKEFD